MNQQNPYMNMYNGMYGNYGVYPQQAVQTPVYQQQPVQQTPQVHMSQMAWVQGESAARAYQLAPGEKVFFMDSEEPFLYAREADMNGKPLPMDKYKLVKVEEQQAESVDMSQYVKVSDISDLISSAVEEEVNRRMSELTLKPATSKK